MLRFSLSRRILPIDLDDFQTLTRHFKAALEATFGTGFSLDIRVLNSQWVYTTFVDDDLQNSLDYENDRHTTLRTVESSDITPEIREAACHVRVSASPVHQNEIESLPYAHGSIEFKGAFPKRATFCVQPDRSNVRASLQKLHRHLVTGDGADAHGRRSEVMPHYLYIH